jgi:hypothetical protein
MSISSIPSSPPAPVAYPNTSTSQTPDVKPDGDANDAGASQPTVQAALPPGQGTRVDQLV